MPNCDWYATVEDHRELLAWLFAERTCHVFELASDFSQPLQQFARAEDVLAQFDRRYKGGAKWHAVHLQLYVFGAGPPFTPRRVPLNPEACDGATFRYAAEGWGLVQLYLQTPREARLENSHTNHNSPTRAATWAATYGDDEGPAQWDFTRITSFSSRLNRHIKKQAVAKVGRRAVLPGALEQWNAGVALGPYVPGEAALTRVG